MKNKGAIIVVNAVTMTRVIGTFIMPVVCNYLTPGGLIIYIMCLLLTDALDGILARRLHACTIFGSLLDQAADKLLGIATLAVLARSYPIMLLPIITETTISIINTRAAIRGASAESSLLGKIKTWVLGITIVGSFCTVFASDIIALLNNNTQIGMMLINFFSNLLVNPEIIMNTLASISVGAGIMVSCDYWIKNKAEIKKAEELGLKIEDIKFKKGSNLIEALFSEEYYQKTKKEPLIKKVGEEKNNEKRNRKK